ncbi:MAG: glycosyltransferase family 4 protein [Syntrophomonadaceae bacterium]|nr:glycosyltransferase family 4 protein [Syntrophomonadaceae bacterium]
MDRLNVLHLLRPSEGGIKKHVNYLIKYHDRNLYNIYLGHPACKSLDLPIPESNKLTVNLKDRFNLLADYYTVKELVSVLSENKIHILHSHGARAFLIGCLAARWAQVPVIVATIHNFVCDSNVPWWQKAAYFKFSSVLVKNADHVFAVSRTLAEHLVEKQRLQSNKVSTLTSGVDLGCFNRVFDCGKMRMKIGLHPSEPVVATISRLIPEKGAGLFIEAAAIINRRMPKVQFLVVGDGSERNRLEKKSIALGLQKQVKFIGWHEDVPSILPLVNVVVVPSLTEGLSLTTLEAMAARRSVVAFAVGGLNELIKHGETGYLVQPRNTESLANSVIELLLNNRKNEEMGRKARRLVEENFCIQKSIDQLQQIYHRLSIEKGLKETGGKKAQKYLL